MFSFEFIVAGPPVSHQASPRRGLLPRNRVSPHQSRSGFRPQEDSRVSSTYVVDEQRRLLGLVGDRGHPAPASRSTTRLTAKRSLRSHHQAVLYAWSVESGAVPGTQRWPSGAKQHYLLNAAANAHRARLAPPGARERPTVVGGDEAGAIRAAYQRCSIGMYGLGAGPVYSARGRIRRLWSYCSSTCAVQPAMRLQAKSGVNRSVVMPSA